jgi:selenophosphate synthase
MSKKIDDYLKSGAIVPVDPLTTQLLVDALKEKSEMGKTSPNNAVLDLLQMIVKQNTLIVQALSTPHLTYKGESK